MADDGRRRNGIRNSALFQAVFTPRERFRKSELYGAVIRHPRPDTPRGRAMTSFHNFFLHVYPVKVPRRVLSWRSTFRLGFITTSARPWPSASSSGTSTGGRPT